jgi:hypothetical protein
VSVVFDRLQATSLANTGGGHTCDRFHAIDVVSMRRRVVSELRYFDTEDANRLALEDQRGQQH